MITKERIGILDGFLREHLKSMKDLRKTHLNNSQVSEVMKADKSIREITRVIADLERDPEWTYKVFEDTIKDPSVEAARTARFKAKNG